MLFLFGELSGHLLLLLLGGGERVLGRSLLEPTSRELVTDLSVLRFRAEILLCLLVLWRALEFTHMRWDHTTCLLTVGRHIRRRYIIELLLWLCIGVLRLTRVESLWLELIIVLLVHWVDVLRRVWWVLGLGLRRDISTGSLF